MRRRHLWKAVASSLLAFSLVVGVCPVSGGPFLEMVEASEVEVATVDDTWETVKEWKFDDSSAGTDGWNGYQYVNGDSKTAADTTLSIVDNKLKVTSDYGVIQTESGAWNPGGVSGGLIEIGASGEARLTFDLYCKQGDALPEHIQLNTAWSDWSNGYYPSQSWDEVVRESNETATIEGNTYNKYQVEFPLTNLTTNDNLTNLILIRSDKRFIGTVYLDNIVLQKKKATEGGGTTGVVYEDAGSVVVTAAANMTDEDYPWGKFEVNTARGVTLPAGTVLEYDMEVANQDFISLYWETDIGWSGLAYENLKGSSDFKGNKRHATFTLDKDYLLNKGDTAWGVEVKTGKASTDYVGVVTCSALKITLPAQPEDEPVTDDLKETVIFSGNDACDTQAWPYKTISLQDAKFDMNRVVENGYFRVEYTTAIDADMNLVLSYYHGADVTNAWVGVAPTSKGAINATENKYYAEYSYDECKAAWEKEESNEGYKNLTAVQYLNPQLQSKSETASFTLTSVKWYGPALPGDDAEVLFTGEKTATGKQASLFYDYTKHVGGEFDTSKIDYGSYFEAVYSGKKDGLILSLSSYSGGTDWIAVKPSSSTDNDDGTHTAKFTIEDCIEGNGTWGGFGTNMKRLDQIAVWTYDENEPVTITLKSLKYYPGNGDVVDQSNESQWTKKKTKGIGLIGDSIVHNPLVNTNDAMGEFKLGDWNKILSRSDCSNWGIGGQTTEHIKNRIKDMLSAPYEYDTFVTLCGINDMGYRNAAEIVANYKEIYEQIHSLRPTAKVYTVSVLPTAKGGIYAGYDKDTKVADTSGQEKICEINRLLQELIADGMTADGARIKDFVTFVNCHSDFLDTNAEIEADRIYANPDYVFKAYDETSLDILDGLHPNEAGYRIIANKLKPLLPEEVIDEDEEPQVIEVNESKAISVTDSTVNDWSSVEYKIADADIIYTGTTVEYDVTVDNKDFTGIYLETDFNWEKVNTRTLTPADFGEGMTAHIKAAYVGEPINKLTGCQIKTGGEGTTYRGNLTCSNLKITLAKPEKGDGGDESAFEETVLFSGSEKIGKNDDKNVLKEIYVSGNFNMNRVMPGGYFYVEYQAPQKEKVILAFNDWEGGSDGWKEISTTESGKVSDGVYYAKFSYLACENALGSKNFSVVDAISVKVPDAAVDLTTIKWVGPKLPNSGNSDYGSSSDSGNAGSDTDKKQNEEKDKDKDKDKDNKGDSNSSGDNAPVIEKKPGQSQNHTVGGQDFVVTKGGKDGKAEVAFMDAPANAKKVVIPKTVVIDGVTCKVLWANFSKTDGFYTPYVDSVNEDGSLHGHEMLDNFISFYNDGRTIFAADQKNVLTKQSFGKIAARAAVEGATGYITSPLADQRILKATRIKAKVTGATKKTDVKFVLKAGKNKVTLKAKADGKGFYTAKLSASQLKKLGAKVGSLSLYIDGKKVQSTTETYNIKPAKADPYLIDGFENYYGVNDQLTRAWTTNADNDCKVTLELVKEKKSEGTYGLKFTYDETATGWGGATIAKEVDWSKCNALQFYTIPDGKNQKVVVQITANGVVYETYLNTYDAYAKSGKKPVLVTIPFSEFVQRDAEGQPKGGLVKDSKKIQSFGLWVNAIGDSSAITNGRVKGTIYYDNITAVTSSAKKATFKTVK